MKQKELKEEMLTAINSMVGRKIYQETHRGFVWGIMWVAHRLGYTDIVKKAQAIMKEIKLDNIEKFVLDTSMWCNSCQKRHPLINHFGILEIQRSLYEGGIIHPLTSLKSNLKFEEGNEMGELKKQ